MKVQLAQNQNLELKISYSDIGCGEAESVAVGSCQQNSMLKSMVKPKPVCILRIWRGESHLKASFGTSLRLGVFCELYKQTATSDAFMELWHGCRWIKVVQGRSSPPCTL